MSLKPASSAEERAAFESAVVERRLSVPDSILIDIAEAREHLGRIHRLLDELAVKGPRGDEKAQRAALGIKCDVYEALAVALMEMSQ